MYAIFSMQVIGLMYNHVMEIQKINELVDARDVSIGAWFEAHIENVTRATKGQKNGKAQVKSGNSYKRTNGNLSQDHSRENANYLDSTPSTSYSDCMDTDEEAIYHIKYDDTIPAASKKVNFIPAKTTTHRFVFLASDHLKALRHGDMEERKAIRSSQHGFTKGKSCLTNLIAFYDGMTEWIES
ncbi:hypothetical protein llap_14769 [Limosa lapponica baueri]|uniref:UHRF1 tandem tudor domain-containing protein n=1 Tax=Limosa lapponica baueri TaxID=1758121 RepID=A0A2I0TM91_LIMLA|nr:hypothetical protein llap_14769 [Limosa lapponica baueri]